MKPIVRHSSSAPALPSGYVLCILLWLAATAVSTAASDAPEPLNRTLDIRPSERLVDHITPSAPHIQLLRVRRGWGSTQPGAITAWGPDGRIEMLVSGATDDRTPSDSLGYRFDYVDGTVPDGLALSSTVWMPTIERELVLTWDDGSTWDQDAFRFRLGVKAVDWAGNESPRSNVVIIGHDGDVKLIKGYARGLAYKDSVQAAWKQVSLDVPTVTDTVRVEAAGTLWPSANVIGEIYSGAVIEWLGHATEARVDSVTFRSPLRPDDVPFAEVDGIALVETGRELTRGEIGQLCALILDPRNYIPIAAKYSCIFDPEYAFSMRTGNDHVFQVFTSTSCHQVVVIGKDVRQGHGFTREAAGLLREFCRGVISLPPLD